MSNDLIARLHARRAHGIVGGTQLVISTNPDALCTEAADALEAQAREIEALRADAARYRWLRDEDDDPVCSLRQLFTTTGKPKDVDAAVDAAMRKGVTP
jgi:hypothetical protein